MKPRNFSTSAIKLVLFLSVLFFTASVTSAVAQNPAGTAVITDIPAGGGLFNYSILLTNTSSTATIGTFWFAWVPGQSYMANAPSNIINPSGWSDFVVTPGGPDAGGYSIEWSTASLLAPGGTEAFLFTSAETPAQLAGDSSFFTGIPEATSFLYSGGAFASPSTQIIGQVTSAPEPRSSILLGFGLMVLFAFRRKLFSKPIGRR